MRSSRLLSSLIRRTPVAFAYRARDDSSRPPPVRRLSVVRPDLVGEWVPDLNDVDVSTVAITAAEAVTWRCSTCSHQWVATVRDRAVGEAGCPECARRSASGITSINSAESIQTTHPEAASRWDYVLNGALRPTDVSEMSTRSVWWRAEDGKESFSRPVYAFVRETRSLREIHATMVEERLTAIETLAPLIGYSVPDNIRRIVDGFKAAPPNAEAFLTRTNSGALSIAEVASFEEMWCNNYHAEKKKKEAEAALSFDETLRRKPQPLTLTLDTSLSSAASGYRPAVPILAMLDYHAEQLTSAVEEAKAYGEDKGTDLPSFALQRESARDAYTLNEATRVRMNAHRVAANRLKFRAVRSDASQLKTREMPSMPSPDSILESESTGVSRIEEINSSTLTDSDFSQRFKPRRTGFRKNQTLDMPDEIDETPMGVLTAAVPEPEAPKAPEPEVVAAPAAPRVVGRRKKSS